jgi:uncharacterized protein YbjT (DUF2867 family)
MSPRARESGIIMSFLQPLDKPVPMVATADVGREAPKPLQESWTGRRVVELEGRRRVTPDEIANTFAEVLGCRVSMDAVPRETWERLFRSQGMNSAPLSLRTCSGTPFRNMASRVIETTQTPQRFNPTQADR